MKNLRPAPIYRVTLYKKPLTFEKFTEFDEAVTFCRNLIEADGNKVFMGETRPGSGVLKWMDWSEELPKFITKTIGIDNSKEIEEWEREEKKRIRIENAKKQREREEYLRNKYKTIVI